MHLTSEQIIFFNENGYLVIENFWTKEVVNKLKNKIIKVIEDLSVTEDSDNNSVFTTTEQIRKTDNYFLESGDKIRFFWESKARKEDGSFTQRPQDCINKIGHALHDLDPDFQQVSYEERVGKICRDLGLEIPIAVQSMYIFKQANIGGEVSAHQDGTFLYTEPQSVLGFWWALDDCYKTNGCLWAVPGSHKHVVTRRFKRKDNGEGTEFFPEATDIYDLTNAVALEIPAGSLVLLHHSLVHYSAENISSTARHAYSIHVIEGKESVQYPRDNWLQTATSFRCIP